MSDLTATNCGCGCDGGNNSILWIIILLCCCGNNNGGCGFSGDNNNCLLLILLLCCCGNNGFCNQFSVKRSCCLVQQFLFFCGIIQKNLRFLLVFLGLAELLLRAPSLFSAVRFRFSPLSMHSLSISQNAFPSIIRLSLSLFSISILLTFFYYFIKK